MCFIYLRPSQITYCRLTSSFEKYTFLLNTCISISIFKIWPHNFFYNFHRTFVTELDFLHVRCCSMVSRAGSWTPKFSWAPPTTSDWSIWWMTKSTPEPEGRYRSSTDSPWRAEPGTGGGERGSQIGYRKEGMTGQTENREWKNNRAWHAREIENLFFQFLNEF